MKSSWMRRLWSPPYTRLVLSWRDRRLLAIGVWSVAGFGLLVTLPSGLQALRALLHTETLVERCEREVGTVIAYKHTQLPYAAAGAFDGERQQLMEVCLRAGLGPPPQRAPPRDTSPHCAPAGLGHPAGRPLRLLARQLHLQSLAEAAHVGRRELVEVPVDALDPARLLAIARRARRADPRLRLVHRVGDGRLERLPVGEAGAVPDLLREEARVLILFLRRHAHAGRDVFLRATADADIGSGPGAADPLRPRGEARPLELAEEVELERILHRGLGAERHEGRRLDHGRLAVHAGAVPGDRG